MTCAADTLRWVAGDGSWHEPGNWNPARVPAANDDVIIDTGAAVTVTYTSGELTLDSLNVTGRLILSDGSLTVTQPSQITGTLVITSGATLAADGPQATLSVTDSATIDAGNLSALDGGHITLPKATRYLAGSLRAQGPGSRLDLSAIDNLGLGGGGELSITDAVSREVSVFNDTSGPPSDNLGILDAVSREVSVFNGAGNPDPNLDILDAVSREVSIFNDTSGSGGPGVNITDANSREVSVFNGSSTAGASITDAVSREVSVENK